MNYRINRGCSEFLCILIYGLFDDAVSSSECTMLNVKIINECRIGNYGERNSHGQYRGTIPHSPRGAEENKENHQ
jgi:hypothetical protein